MCGIVGYLGGQSQAHKVLSGLRRLEYRGYDSFGMAGVVQGEILAHKRIGAIGAHFDTFCVDDFADSVAVISHTRWATHGRVTEQNAHPILSCDGSIAIVHNGVIDNSEALFARYGWPRNSETDTEAIANLFAEEWASSGDVEAAVARCLRELKGEFACLVLLRDQPDCMIAIKRKSPLMLMAYEEGVAFASDEFAFADFKTHGTLAPLGDDTAAIVRGSSATMLVLRDGVLKTVEAEWSPYFINLEEVDLGTFPHYMLKEIHESPAAVRSMVQAISPMLDRIVSDLGQREISLVGSGSSFFVALLGQYYFAGLGERTTTVHPSDEFLNLHGFRQRDHLIAISQSGTTYDVLEVIQAAKSVSAAVTCINNVRNSTAQQLATFPVFQNAGREVCVLSTKSLVSQSVALFLLALEFGLRTGVIEPHTHAQLRDDLDLLEPAIEAIFKSKAAEIKTIAERNSHVEHWFFVGRGIHTPIALEGALKFKEVSYLHAEGLSAGFLKHGTISLIDERFRTVAMVPSAVSNPELYALTMASLNEIKSRNGVIIGFGFSDTPESDRSIFDEYIEIGPINIFIDPILQQIICHFFAYYCARSLGREIDRPRGLAKSVTVK